MDLENSYQTKTDNLFERWKAQSIQDGFTDFCEDGLMYRGEITCSVTQDGKTFWFRKNGSEDALWDIAPKRVMFLNKDVPYNPNQDIREWILRQNETDITALHYKNIALWLYGLLNIDDSGRSPIFEDINDTKIYSPFIDKTPIAIVNCKKESGVSRISNETLSEHIERYKGFLKDQIQILDPDIIVCGGGSSMIKDFVKTNVYPRLEKINNWMYFDKFKNKLVIDSFHPSYYGLSKKEIYDRMMTHYQLFLTAYPEFLNSCR